MNAPLRSARWAGLVLMLAACGPKIPNTTMSGGQFAAALDGSWTVDGDIVYTFEKRGAELVYTGIEGGPGSYEARGSGTTPDGYYFTTYIPFSNRVTTHYIVEVTGEGFTTRMVSMMPETTLNLPPGVEIENPLGPTSSSGSFQFVRP